MEHQKIAQDRPALSKKKGLGRAPPETRQLMVRRSAARRRPMESWHVYIEICLIKIYGILLYTHYMLFKEREREREVDGWMDR